MRQIFPFNFALAVTCLSFALIMEANAQQKVKPDQRQVQQTAANKPAAKQALPPNEDPSEILERWEEQSSKIKSLHGKQYRSEFNHVFGVEKVSQGPFFLETPDKGRIDMLSVKIDKDAVSKKMIKPKNPGDKPKPYTLETGKSERWICTGDEILMMNVDEKTYQKEIIPAEQRGQNIVNSPLPFLFGMKAEEAKHRFKLTIFKETNEYVVLIAEPKMAKDQENYQKAAITLDKKTYLPTQVRLLDQNQAEIVYTFESVVVNDRDIKSRLSKLFGMDRDPYNPSLKGFTAVVPANAPIADDVRARPPVQAQRRPNGDDAPQRR